MADVPHLAFPFRWGPNGHAVELEQDSEEEIVNCVQLILACDVESLIDQPDFGITDPTFTLNPNILLLQHQIESWEPRATLDLSNDLDTSDFTIQDIHIQVKAGDIGG